MNKLFILILFLLCFTIYFNALNNDFVLDDKVLIVNNHSIKSLRFLTSVFKNDIHTYGNKTMEFTNYYRPLQILSYAVDYRIWKLNPFGFRLTNILLHLFNCILIYYLLFNIFNKDLLSKAASILFLVHPVHTSAVTYISGRADLLACFFMLLSIILFLRFIKLNSKIYYWMSLFCAFLALFSRENALTLFLLMAIILSAIKARPKYYLYIIPFILLDLFYLSLRFIIFHSGALLAHSESLSLPLRIANFFNIVPRYLLLLVFPLDLHFFRSTPFIPSLSGIKMLYPAIFALLIIVSVIKFRRHKLANLGILWFLFGLIPVFFCLDNYYTALGEAMMAESWLYLPSIGFLIILALMFSLWGRLGRILFFSFVIFYGCFTIVNNNYWKNNLTFAENTLKYTPGKNHLRLALIEYYLENGLIEDAFAEIKKFSFYNPDAPSLFYVLGNYYFTTGDIDKAIKNYNISISKDKDFFRAYYNLSSCYARLGQYDSAIDSALQCFKIKPYYLDNLIRLGDLYSKNKEFEEARKYYSLALEIDPNNQLVKEKLKNAQ